MQDIALKILVIEDNDALREATLTYLQQQGHFVRGVAMAEEINDIVGGFVPDVYVIANYKETQLTRVKPGQPVDVRRTGA